MAKQCVVNRNSEGEVSSVVVPNFSISDNTEFSGTPEEVLEQVIDRLLKNSIVNNVRLVSQGEFSRIVADLNVKQIGAENARGFYNSATREIVLNNTSPDLLNTTLHEFAHPFLQTIRETRPDIYNAGLKVLQDNYEIVERYEETVRRNYPALDENSDEFKEEILANIIADKGARLIKRENKANDILSWIRNFWNNIKEILGISTYSSNTIEDMTFQEFSEAMVSEMFNGGLTKYSISALQRPEFTELRGKKINPVTIQNLVKGQGIKQIEKDIINSILDLEIFQNKKIDYDTFEKAVQANVMPLTKIESDNHASYGKLEGMKYDSYQSFIYNSPLNHGLTGHFAEDYGEYDYDININKGLFGHTRVWTKDKIFYVAEVQSDAFQKTTVEDIGERERRLDYEQELQDHEVTQGNSMVRMKEQGGYRFFTKDGQTSVYSPSNRFGLPMGDSTGVEITETPNGKTITLNGENIGGTYFGFDDVARKQIELYANTEGTFREGTFLTRDEIPDNLKEDFDYVTKGYYTKLAEIQKKYREATPSFVKQFNASEKVFELRLIRESIKEAANRGFEKLRLPTAYTISVIEGYVGGDGQGDLLDNDYPVVGERVRYLGNEMEILEVLSMDEVRVGDSIEKEVRSVKLDMIELFDNQYDSYEDFRNALTDDRNYSTALQYFDNVYSGHIGIFNLSEIPSVDSVIQTYLENTPQQRNWGSEIISLNSIQVRPDAFTLDYLLDSQKPIARRYDEFGEMMKKERGADNFRIVKDESGNPWYETDITEQDEENPIIAFQIIGEQGASNLDLTEEVTHRIDNLNVARDMENADKTAKEIRLATGWERGADGKWRYEIIDNKVTFTEKDSNLVDLLTNNELYIAYPFLKSTKIKITSGWDARADVRNNIIEIGRRINESDYSEMVIHEIQHLIQNVENFSTGSNTTVVRGSILKTFFQDENLNEKIKGLTNQLDDLLKSIRDYKKIEKDESYRILKESQNQEERAKAAEDYNRISREFIQNSSENKGKINDLKDKINSLKKDKSIDRSTLDKLLNEKFKTSNSYDLYKMVSGETEARNAQTRANMSMEERRATLLSETEDVAREDQIILGFNSNTEIKIKQNEIIPSVLYKALSEQPFINKEQALDAYKNIYSDNLNGWQNKELDC